MPSFKSCSTTKGRLTTYVYGVREVLLRKKKNYEGHKRQGSLRANDLMKSTIIAKMHARDLMKESGGKLYESLTHLVLFHLRPRSYFFWGGVGGGGREKGRNCMHAILTALE